MQQITRFIFLVAVIFMTLCTPVINASQRIDQLLANEEGVFLLVGDIWLSAEAIQVTSQDVLLFRESQWVSLDEAMQCGGSNYWVWQCPICGCYNAWGAPECSNRRNHPK